jgi:hypothetical protein
MCVDRQISAFEHNHTAQQARHTAPNQREKDDAYMAQATSRTMADTTETWCNAFASLLFAGGFCAELLLLQELALVLASAPAALRNWLFWFWFVKPFDSIRYGLQALAGRRQRRTTRRGDARI